MGYGGMAYNYRGDPFLGGLVKGALKFASGGVKALFGRGQQPPAMATGGLTGGLPVMPGGGIVGGVVRRARVAAQAIVPGGVEPGGVGRTTATGRKRPRMNPANPRALRRAIRRQDGFVKLARRALKGSGYTIVSRGSRRPKRDIGPGHTHVR